MKIDAAYNLDEQMNTFMRVLVYDKDENVITESDACFLKDKYLNLQKPNIKYKLECNGDEYFIHLMSNTYTKYVWVDLKKDDAIFSDNFFNLYPYETKVISFKSKKKIKEKDIKIINLVDSY